MLKKYAAIFFLFFLGALNIIASNSDRYISNIYTLNSRTIVLETYIELPDGSDYPTANESAENYQLLSPPGFTVTLVRARPHEKKITLSLSDDLSLEELVTISYSNIYMTPSLESEEKCSGELTFKVLYTPERPKLIGIPLTWGDTNSGKLDTSGLENIVAVAAGRDHSLYLKNDGTVINKGSAICDGVASWIDIVAISSREHVAAGLKADGTVLLAGKTLFSDTSWEQWTNMVQVVINSTSNNEAVIGLGSNRKIKIAGSFFYDTSLLALENIVAIGVGEGEIPFFAALDTDETLHWFSMDNTTGMTVADVDKFAVGYQHLIYIKKDGTIVVERNPNILENWNLDDTEGLDGNLIEAIAAGNSHNLYLMDGDVIIKGISEKEWTKLPAELSTNNAPVIAVAAGRNHSVALLKAEGQDEENTISETFSINEGELWEYVVEIPKLDGKVVDYSFSLEPLPENMVFNKDNGAFYWPTDETDGPGDYQILFRVVDVEDSENFVDVELSIEVKEVNQPPTLQVNDITVTAGVALDILVLAEDLDFPENVLTFSLVSSPNGMSIDPSSGRIFWNTTDEDVGTHTVTIEVCDDFDPPGSDSKSFLITVNEASQPLKITKIPNAIIPELVQWSCLLKATGGAGGYQWSLIEGPEGMTLSADVLSWTPTEAQGDGTAYPVTVQVKDTGGNTSEMDFILEVLEVNTPPVIDSIANKTVQVGDTLTFTVVAADFDLPANTLAYALEGGAPQGMQIDPASGVITFTLSKELYQSDPYRVTVVLSDGLGLSAQTQFSLYTEYINKAPVIAGNVAEVTIPELSPANITELLGWDFYDEDNERLFFALAEGFPQGMSVSAEGEILWEPTEKQGPGIYNVTLEVSDQDLIKERTTSKTFTVIVTEVNSPPYFVDVEEQEAIVGESFSLTTLKAIDTDIPVQKLSYSLQEGAPDGLRLYPNGDIIWTPTAGQVGEHVVTVLVVDDGTPPESATATLKITVTEASVPPLYFLPVGEIRIKEHSLFQVSLLAGAKGGTAPLTYSFMKSESGMYLEPLSGSFSWVPGEEDGGKSFEVIVRASETSGHERSAQISFTIVVDEVNDPPSITPIALQRVDEETVLSVTVTAEDPEGDALTYSVVSIDPGEHIQEGDVYFNGNVFNWQTREPHGPGGYTVTIRATDTGGLFAEASFRVLVRAINNPPRFTISQTVFDVNQGQEFTTIITAEDDDIPVEKLAFSKTSGPEGLTIHPHTGVVCWQVPLNYPTGETTFGVQVADVNAGGATMRLTLNVLPWATVSPTSGIMELSASLYEGEPFEFCLDTESTTGWEWELLSSPKGMVLDSENSTLYWTPGELDGGHSREVLLEAKIEEEKRIQPLRLVLDVIEVNSPPWIEELRIPAFGLNQEVRFFVKTGDPDIPVQNLKLVLLSPLPSGASFNPSTGEFSWRPTQKSQFMEPGCNLKFRVTDSGEPSLNAETEVILCLLESEADEPSLQYEYEPSVAAAKRLKLSWDMQEEKEYFIFVSTANPGDEWLLAGKVCLTSDAVIFESNYALRESCWFYLEDDLDNGWPVIFWEKTEEGLIKIVWQRDHSSSVGQIKINYDGVFLDWESLLKVDFRNHKICFQQELGTSPNGIRNARVSLKK